MKTLKKIVGVSLIGLGSLGLICVIALPISQPYQDCKREAPEAVCGQRLGEYMSFKYSNPTYVTAIVFQLLTVGLIPLALVLIGKNTLKKA